MASRNPDAVANQGEFHASKPRDEPMMTKGHAPSTHVGNDARPEFHAQTLPAGSAPAESTFQPNPISEVPGQANNDAVLRSHGKESTKVSASDTLGGATSRDVHTGYGHPGQGQTSADAKHARTQGQGLVGVGASGAQATMAAADERVDPRQRGVERETARQKDTVGETPNAEEREPVGAEQVAAERD
ncbi:MAG: hypothetical protein LQ340_006123 [Diploschistes diacapsis]|nr:MAG: hypothetical protein LQ340_006123 [Diploschistes diacapsis]